MRACGISLYRTAAPLLLFAVAASAVLFGLQEQVMAYSNREADRLNRVIRGLPPASFGALDRRWMVGAERRHLSLRCLRREEERVSPVRRLSPGSGALGSALDHPREPRRADTARRLWRGRRRSWNGSAFDRLVARVFGDDGAETSRRPPSSTSSMPSGAAARISRLLQERRARRGADDVRPAQTVATHELNQETEGTSQIADFCTAIHARRGFRCRSQRSVACSACLQVGCSARPCSVSGPWVRRCLAYASLYEVNAYTLRRVEVPILPRGRPADPGAAGLRSAPHPEEPRADRVGLPAGRARA